MYKEENQHVRAAGGAVLGAIFNIMRSIIGAVGVGAGRASLGGSM